jgi:hypothetical protein
MNKSTYHPLGNTVRLLLIVALAIALTLGTGQKAQAAASPAPVNLGEAAHFVILSKSGISNVPISAITGDIGTSPIDSTAITGFSLVADSTNTFSTSSQVTGKVYAADYAPPTPTNMTTAVSNMEAAFTDAAGRSLPDFTELYAGDLSGQTLAPGLYKWSTGILITTNVTLAGPSNAVWIFQIAGDLTLGSGAQVLLSGGAQADNIFWQVGGGTGVEIGTTAHMEGNILAAKAIHLRTGASLNGRALAQTAVTLDQNTVVIPAPGVVITVPMPPVLAASDGAYLDKVLGTWPAVSDATYYVGYRSESLTGAKIPQGGMETSSLTAADSWAVPGLTYYYWVKACNTNGCREFSAAETGWRGLTAPVVTASDGTFSDTVRGTWPIVTGATSYIAYRSDTLDGVQIPTIGLATTTPGGDDLWAASGVTYYYWVKACNGSNCSALSANETGWR